MSFLRRLLPALCGLTLLGVAGPVDLHAQDEVDEATLRWLFTADFSAVFARGNAESATLGLGATARRKWERDEIRFDLGWVRVETGTVVRRAVGDADDFTVEREVNTEKTAENMFARGRYDRTFSDHWFGYGAVDWMRNTFAGIDSRTLLALGAGTQWIDTDRTDFSTDYGVTWTFQEDVVPNPDVEDSFGGLRLGYDLRHDLTASTVFTSRLTFDQNLNDTEDRRLDWGNSVTVDINDVLALKPSLLLQWRNLPSLGEVPLFSPGGVDTGTTVLAPLRKLDTTFTIALVLTL
ncbi:MAG: DUF481 domain-containing protein [Gemmatimonadota bacterium]